jgi:hypothetical protein
MSVFGAPSHPRLGRIKLAKLTPMQVQRFIRNELAAGKGAATVKQSLTTLRMVLSTPCCVVWSRATSPRSSRVSRIGRPSAGPSRSTSSAASCSGARRPAVHHGRAGTCDPAAPVGGPTSARRMPPIKTKHTASEASLHTWTDGCWNVLDSVQQIPNTPPTVVACWESVGMWSGAGSNRRPHDFQ